MASDGVVDEVQAVLREAPGPCRGEEAKGEGKGEKGAESFDIGSDDDHLEGDPEGEPSPWEAIAQLMETSALQVEVVINGQPLESGTWGSISPTSLTDCDKAATVFNIATPQPEPADEEEEKQDQAPAEAEDIEVEGTLVIPPHVDVEQPTLPPAAEKPADEKPATKRTSKSAKATQSQESRGQDTEEAQERRKLCNLMWVARPSWDPKDLVAAERKLQKVGIHNVSTLSSELEKEALNRRLQRRSIQAFHEETLAEFKRRAAEALTDGNGKPQEKLGELGLDVFSPKRFLCDVLWASRTEWTPPQLVQAERKLAAIGVEDLPALDEAFERRDLNQRLRQVGEKVFSQDTLNSLRQHLANISGRSDEEIQQAAAFRLRAIKIDPELREMLWQAKPHWSGADLAAVMRRLTMVGVYDEGTMRQALREGLNKRCRIMKLKTFSSETIREFERTFGACYDPSLAKSPAGFCLSQEHNGSAVRDLLGDRDGEAEGQPPQPDAGAAACP